MSNRPDPPPLPEGKDPRAWFLAGFGRLPEGLRLRLVRRLTPNYTLGALCLLEHRGRLLLLRQSHRWGWTLPGGLVDRGETAEAAVRREMLEETGLVVEVGLPIGTVVDPAQQRVDVIFHVAVDRTFVVHPRSEAVQAQWLTPEQAGPVDGSTGQALDLWARAQRPDPYTGRLVEPDG